MNKKYIFLFLAGCIIILIVLFIGRDSKRKAVFEDASLGISQGRELSPATREDEQAQSREKPVVEEAPLAPGEPLLN